MAMMAHTSNKGYDGMELLDLLFDQTDGILRQDDVCHREWPVTQHSMLRPADGGNDFLDTLLSGSDSVSVSGSPLWSPSPSDSGISEDPNSDQIDSPMPPDSPPFETCYLQAPQLTQSALDTAEPDVSIDLDGWESRYFPERTGEIQCASDIHRTQLSLGFPLTVKDLLLSGTSEPPQQPSQQSFQELILSEDEKKLLAKEGVSLPTQLPLTKYEERILKKIRRKIRNKQSAQESRKKKKEYIDGLEGRMAACSAHNQELQRKVLQLEKNNSSLMEQLRRLQALVMNGTNKAAQTGTCVLVLLLSFSLILFPSLQPFSSSKVTEVTDFSAVRVQSRSLHSVVEVQQTLPAFSLDKGVEAVTSLLARLKMKQEFAEIDAVPHNHSLAEQNHQSGDPITGHVTAVTWTAHRDAPHADDM